MYLASQAVALAQLALRLGRRETRGYGAVVEDEALDAQGAVHLHNDEAARGRVEQLHLGC